MLIERLRITFLKLTQNPVFILSIKNGKVKKLFGNVNPNFFQDSIDIAKMNNLESGLIFATKGQHTKFTIKTFGKISSEMLQQLRNSWGSMHK